MLVTSVTAIASILVEAVGLSRVKFNYTGGNRGWKGDVPQVRFDITKMKNLGWKQCHCERSVATRYSSDEAVRQAVKVILSKDELLT